MKYSGILAASFAALCAAAPISVEVEKRQAAPLTDIDILQFALTLENLEATFYRQGLANFSQDQFLAAGFTQTFFNDFTTIAKDEATHVEFLKGAISAAGASPVAECTYNFPVTDVKSFVAVSSLLEGVGVSAYLGAASSVQNKDTLTAAASIMTVEARHSAFVRALQPPQSPFAQPFDDPLGPNQVFTLAASFIVSCPSTNAALPFKAFPPLAMGSGGGAVKAGSTVTILTPGYALVAAPGGSLFAAFVTVTGPVFAQVTAVDGGFSAVIPPGVAGQSYLVMTGCKDEVSDATVAAGPLIVEISE